MIRYAISVAKTASYLGITRPSTLGNCTQRNFVSSTFQRCFSLLRPTNSGGLLLNSSPAFLAANPVNIVNTRTVTKYSMRKGKRKSVKAVLKRFYRLHWGMWIRRIAGCHKKLWKKSPPRKRRLRQHVFCNSTQSYQLDKMVGSYWRRPKYYVDDPYAPYHTRDEFQFTYRKPRPYVPPENS